MSPFYPKIEKPNIVVCFHEHDYPISHHRCSKNHQQHAKATQKTGPPIIQNEIIRGAFHQNFLNK